MVLIIIVTGAYKPTYNWGASHCKNPCFRVLGGSGVGIQTWLPRISLVNEGMVRCENHVYSHGVR